MVRIVISGCNGRMGGVVTRMCRETDNMQVAAGFDINSSANPGYPVYTNPMDFAGEADVVIDFSAPASLDSILEFCKTRKIPAVLCTTGYSDDQLARVIASSADIPLFRSGNMSLGVNLMTSLLKKAAAVLGDRFDVEIVERHHRNKVDAPSGTALMLADAVASGLDYEPEYVYERQSVRQPRGAKEIGISAVRGGTIVGDHEVIFAGTDEVIEFRHTAYSREVFATGAITAARFMAGVSAPGMYDMNDALAEILSK